MNVLKPEMKRQVLATDGTSAHFGTHTYSESKSRWDQAYGFSPRSVLGDLRKGRASHFFQNINGPDFSLISGENIAQINKNPECIGGFCFLHRGEVCASGVSAEGKIMRLDLVSPPPKPFFEGGAEILKHTLEKLGIADPATIGNWKLEVPGLERKVNWGVLVKAMHYFEIARATGGRLTLFIPSHEYTVSTIANASILKIGGGKAEKALQDLAHKYYSFLAKIGEVFFSDVSLKIILTHNKGFRQELAQFMASNPKINETEMGAGDGFIGGSDKDRIRAIRELWKEESDSYLALFGYIFSLTQPTIFMLHGRDLKGYPLEGMEGASKQFDPEQIRKNVAWLGVPSAPIITVKGNSLPLLGRGSYGHDTKKLAEIPDNVPPGTPTNLPRHTDARFDDYYGLPGEFLTSGPLPEDMGNHTLKPNGDCPFFIYVRNLLPYVDVPEDAMIKALNKCRSGQSHDGCRAVFIEAHRQVSQKLGC